MSVLAPAVGAVIAAIIESSVLTHLQVGSIRPDLVFAVGVALAMVLGFDSAMSWAFAGGVTLDLLLPGRPLGATTLALVLTVGAALLVARATWPPRLAIIAGTALLLSPAYQLLLLFMLSLIVDVAVTISSASDLVLIALLNALVASVAVIAVRAIDLRFGEPERLAW